MTNPADVLVANWSFGKPVAFDLITSPLNPSILSEAGVMAGSAALVAECHKHDSNGPKCSELGWKCTPLAVETYGCWGAEARETLSRLATRLAIPMRCTKSKATAPIYGKLSLTLLGVPSVEIGVPSVEIGVPSVEIGVPSVEIGVPSVEIGVPSVEIGVPSVEIVVPSVADLPGFKQCAAPPQGTLLMYK
ncbi:hypothetical protein EMCRGX_G008145 [Ephydatia muelleri]